MPEKRLADARQTLPEGYQFGDARRDVPHDGRVYRMLSPTSGFHPLALVSVLPMPGEAPVPDLDHRWGGDPTVRNFIE